MCQALQLLLIIIIPLARWAAFVSAQNLCEGRGAPFVTLHPQSRSAFAGKNTCQCIFALSQLTLKVKGQRRPAKAPQDICTLSSAPSLSLLPSLTLFHALPLCECRSEHCSRPLAFAESCTAMRSLCLLPLSSSPLPLLSAASLPPVHLSLLPSLAPSISAPLLNFQSHSGAEDIPPFPSFPFLPHSLSLMLKS